MVNHALSPERMLCDIGVFVILTAGATVDTCTSQVTYALALSKYLNQPVYANHVEYNSFVNHVITLDWLHVYHVVAHCGKYHKA